MDAANKTEKIAAPDGKHDDYCDSSVMGIHATLSMLPGSASFTSTNRGGGRQFQQTPRTYGKSGIFTTSIRKTGINKGIPL